MLGILYIEQNFSCVMKEGLQEVHIWLPNEYSGKYSKRI